MNCLSGRGSPKRLKSYWRAVRHCEWCQGLDDFEHLIPCRLFGDGVQVSGLGKSWGRSLSCLTLSGMLNQSRSKLQQLLLGVWWKKQEREGTLQAIYTVLSWSLEALRTGLYPSHSPSGDLLNDELGGQYLANGYRGIVLVRSGYKNHTEYAKVFKGNQENFSKKRFTDE
eukprot:6490463-Amphidinium_carterae.3